MKIAIVHDFLKEYGGAERVVEALHDIWPDAPIYTSFVDYDALGPHAERIKKWKIIESPFGKTWLMRKFHSPLRFLIPLVWKDFDFSRFDVVISSSGWYISRGIPVKKQTIHMCYLHHPPRHLYGYQTAMDWQKYWPIRIYGMIVNYFLRMYDYQTAQRVDYFIANSEETKRRIEKFYRRDAEVIYPPVDIKYQKSPPKADQPLAENIKNANQISKISNYYLVVSRLARAKHIDLVIKACQQLKKPLVIVGKGREEEYLKSMISAKGGSSSGRNEQGSMIKFLGEVPDEELPSLYANAQALIFPAEDEEFGIVPVESMGYGTPVIVYRSGGLTETIIEGKTGVFFDELKTDAMIAAIKKFEKAKWSKEGCKKRAAQFSKERFRREITSFVSRIYNKN